MNLQLFLATLLRRRRLDLISALNMLLYVRTAAGFSGRSSVINALVF
jgi:hypothetical protein